MHIWEHLKGFILQNVLQSFDMHSILQIKENISIRCQTLTYTGKGMVAVHFLPELQYPGRYR